MRSVRHEPALPQRRAFQPRQHFVQCRCQMVQFIGGFRYWQSAVKGHSRDPVRFCAHLLDRTKGKSREHPHSAAYDDEQQRQTDSQQREQSIARLCCVL